MLSPALRQTYTYSARLAAEWMVHVAQKREVPLTHEANRNELAHVDWTGSIRGEYRVADHQWAYFCPVWHTGQAIKALALLSSLVEDAFVLDGARLGAQFLLANSVRDPDHPDLGLLLAYEDYGTLVNTSAVLEAADGLAVLARVTGDEQYETAATRAVEWAWRTQYMPGEGLFWDLYDPAEGRRVDAPGDARATKRPLNDDAQLLRTATRTGNAGMKAAFYEVCERLLREEEPPGNWIRFGPCDARAGRIHPRHAYWWGRPFVDAYYDSGDERYLAAATRAGEWYLHATRHDGGLFRNTYVDFTTDSFGHATSGAACAVLLWHDLFRLTGEDRWWDALTRGLQFCQRMQFTLPRDEALHGCILEKVLPFDGTDRNPYHVRDLGTIFYVQAVAEVLAGEAENQV